MPRRFKPKGGVEPFLRSALGAGPVAVGKLEKRARADGLLGPGQKISNAENFKAAKAKLGIRHHRDGFGRDASYFWNLPVSPATSIADAPAQPIPLGILPADTPVDASAVSPPETQVAQTPVDGSAVSTPTEIQAAQTPVHASAVSNPCEIQVAQTPVDASAVPILPDGPMAPRPAERPPVSTSPRGPTVQTPDNPSPVLPPWKAADHRRFEMPGRPVPAEWVEGVRRLLERPRPFAIPPHIWKQFLADCREFLSKWAETAAQLDWDASSLFGSRYERPHEHLGDAGLLWNLAGWKIRRLRHENADIFSFDGKSRTVGRGHWSTVTLP